MTPVSHNIQRPSTQYLLEGANPFLAQIWVCQPQIAFVVHVGRAVVSSVPTSLPMGPQGGHRSKRLRAVYPMSALLCACVGV